MDSVGADIRNFAAFIQEHPSFSCKGGLFPTLVFLAQLFHNHPDRSFIFSIQAVDIYGSAFFDTQ